MQSQPNQPRAAYRVPNIDLVKCNACGQCVALCPTQAVILRDGKAFIIHPHLCIYCDVCETFCPEGAIGRPFDVVFAPDQLQDSAND